ncbi:MAG: hypothetical protein WBY88_07595 [Desulfosarcina sp.]
MDDFLHNLRSGKLKQPDRGRRDYPDYKGPQRRAGNERRKPTDYYTKVTNENFALIKDSLDTLAQYQKNIADALTERTSTESRIADALEAVATMIGRHFGYTDPRVGGGQTVDAKSNPDRTEGSRPDADTGDERSRDTDPQPTELLDTIQAIRSEGGSWEKIARHLDQAHIPTVSGKGKWRGPAVKKFWDAHADTPAK